MNLSLHQLFHQPAIQSIAKQPTRRVEIDLHSCQTWIMKYMEDSDVAVYYQDLYEDCVYDHITLKQALKSLVAHRRINIIKSRHDYTMYEKNNGDEAQLSLDL